MVDILTGELIVTKGKIKISDITDWTRSNNNGAWDHYVFISNHITYLNLAGPPKEVMCDTFKFTTQDHSVMPDHNITKASNAKFIYIRADECESVTAFKNAYDNVDILIPYATPVTYQLTPTEIRSLLGTNNVWADCGPVNVRYFVQSTQPMIDYIDEKTIVYFDAQEDFSTYDISLVGATSTDIKNCLLANKNANIVIRVKRYSTILLYYLREYSPNYFAEFATHAVIFDAEGTKSMRINYLRLDLTQETSDFTDDYIILPTS